MRRRKFPHSVFLLAAAAGAVFLVVAAISFRESGQKGSIQFEKTVTGTGPEGTLATGLRFDEYSAGRRLFTLSVDSVRLSRKKVGVFRLGFWKVARLEKVRIDFYEPPLEALPVNDKAQKVGVLKDHKEFPDLAKVLLKQEKPGFLPLKGAKGIEISGLTMVIHRRNGARLSINSEKAALDLRDKNLILEGNVSIESGEGRTLESERICWDLEENRFRIEGPYLARLNKRVFKGNGLDTDPALGEFAAKGGSYESF